MLVDAYRAWSADRAVRLGAGLAYYSLFALVPVLFLAISLAGALVGTDTAEAKVEEGIADVLGPEIAAQVTTGIEQLMAESNAALIPLISLGVLMVTASLLFVAWKEVVDIIWGLPREPGIRGTIARRLFGVVSVVGAGALLTLTIFAETLFGALDSVVDQPTVDAIIRLAGSLVPLLLGASVLAVMFRLSPHTEVTWRSVWPAALVTMAMLSLGAGAYGIYLGSFGFASASGVAGTLFLGLAFIYYAAQILLFGVELSKILDLRIDGQIERDT